LHLPSPSPIPSPSPLASPPPRNHPAPPCPPGELSRLPARFLFPNVYSQGTLALPPSLSSPRLASPRLASPRFVSPPLPSPRLPSPPLPSPPRPAPSLPFLPAPPRPPNPPSPPSSPSPPSLERHGGCRLVMHQESCFSKRSPSIRTSAAGMWHRWEIFSRLSAPPRRLASSIKTSGRGTSRLRLASTACSAARPARRWPPSTKTSRGGTSRLRLACTPSLPRLPPSPPSLASLPRLPPSPPCLGSPVLLTPYPSLHSHARSDASYVVQRLDVQQLGFQHEHRQLERGQGREHVQHFQRCRQI
jgi:hypothetical protein